MTDLEQQLLALGAGIGFPPTPELAMPTATEPRPRPRRLVLAGIALAALAICFGAVLAASPGARSGLRDLFGIGSVRVTRLEDTPPDASGPLVRSGSPSHSTRPSGRALRAAAPEHDQRQAAIPGLPRPDRRRRPRLVRVVLSAADRALGAARRSHRVPAQDGGYLDGIDNIRSTATRASGSKAPTTSCG